MGAGLLFIFFLEAGLLLFTCGVGKKYTGHVFFFGLAILLVWIFGAVLQMNWLMEWLNIYLVFMASFMIMFAAMVGEIFKQLKKQFGRGRR